MWLGVVAAVGEERVGAAAWAARLPRTGGIASTSGSNWGDVGPVGAGEQAGKRDAVGVGDQVVLRACLGPVNRTRPGLAVPKSARGVADSQTAGEKSSCSA